eukprot:scaffold1900_cov123-Cylindrotheca_fusiformis.AAC.28
MTKLILLALIFSGAHSWTEPRKPIRRGQELAMQAGDEQNPCWQDLYDDDCSMDTIYQASFVASEWLKSMPCAAGLEDCDMPEEWKLPGNRHEEFEAVDVMQFLNLKRASPLVGSDKGDSEGSMAP